MLKVAVILTGELRYIDFCYKWWQETVKKSGFEVDFYSSTWPHLNNVSLDNNVKSSIAEKGLTAVFPKCNFKTYTDDIIFDCDIPPELTKYVLISTHKIPYFFGRIMHLNQTMQHNDMRKYDVIMHSRWDCAFRNSNFFIQVIDSAVHNVTASGLKCDKGLLWTDDWVLAGPGNIMREIYTDSLQKHIDLFLYYYKKDPTVAYTYLIGHNIYTTYIQNQLKTISSSKFDTTLVRKHNLDFRFDDDTWAKLLKIHMDSTTPV